MRVTTLIHPFLVNNEYQPTLYARTGALTLLRIACVSASFICSFQILRSASSASAEAYNVTAGFTIYPFWRVASDGISYEHPVKRAPTPLSSASTPDVVGEGYNPAYLAMGGGMREDVVVQFNEPGEYVIAQVRR